MTVPGALSVIESLSSRLGEQLLIGAGTVLTRSEVADCVQAGARFIVSPGCDPEVLGGARDLGVAVMPGALTPTEVIAAWKAGASMVKVFPCSALGGASYLKALRGPLPHVKLMPTGGVNLKTAKDYIHAGACALGVGSELVDQVALKEGRDIEISERGRALLSLVEQARAERSGGGVRAHA
jgi:2-dehydro-3-deoxyphosphogluconate aldolase/(4S)-4-hydroxy-2-oxoglutarate aldolase